MIRLATLDMAGTTVDDGHHVYRVLAESVTREGASITDAQLQEWMGTEKRDAITNLLRIGGVEADEAQVEAAFTWFLAELERAYRQAPPTPLPGVVDGIAALRARGIKVVLTTGFTRSIAYPILAAMGWTTGDDESATIDGIVCADEVRRGRPAPYMIFRAMELAGVESVEQTSATGDTVADVEAGRNAGVLAIAVTSGKLPATAFDGVDVDHVIPGVADLLDLPEFAGVPAFAG